MNFSSSAPVRQPVPELPEHDLPVAPGPEETLQSSGSSVAYMRLLWEQRKLLRRVVFYGFLGSTLLAFLIPVRFKSTARLMPPDSSQSGGLAMAAAALSGGAGGLGGIATDMLGLKSSSDIFVGILTSRTVQDKLIQQFDLKKLYADRRMEDARKDLAEHTDLSVDRKSQIITITVTDHDAKRAAAMGQAYMEELNRLVAELSTSSARRERIFYRIPYLRDWLTIYTDSLATDNITPFADLPRGAFAPGIYLTRFPKLPKLDLRFEAAYTDTPKVWTPPRQPLAAYGQFNYWDSFYHDLYTNEGFLIGSPVGREGHSYQAWTTYHVSSRNSIQFGYRHSSVASDFVPGGGNINDASVSANWWFRGSVNVTALLQYEKWNYPLLASTPQTNWTSSVQVQFYPQSWRK